MPSAMTGRHKEQEAVGVIGMGPVWIAAQTLLLYHDREVTMNVELSMLEDAINSVSPYAELRNAARNADFQKF
jgi:hypothetical protein